MKCNGLRGNLAAAIEPGLQGLCDFSVNLLARAAQHRLISGLLNQGMLENISRRGPRSADLKQP